MKYIKTFEKIEQFSKFKVGDKVVWNDISYYKTYNNGKIYIPSKARNIAHGDICEITNVKKYRNPAYGKSMIGKYGLPDFLYKAKNNKNEPIMALYNNMGNRIFNPEGNWFEENYFNHIVKIPSILDEESVYRLLIQASRNRDLDSIRKIIKYVIDQNIDYIGKDFYDNLNKEDINIISNEFPETYEEYLLQKEMDQNIKNFNL